MGTYTFSKYDYCKCLVCPKKLWLDRHKPQEADKSREEVSSIFAGNSAKNLALTLWGKFVKVPFSEDLAEMTFATGQFLKSGEKNIAGATFCYKEAFCRIDMLRLLSSKEIEFYLIKNTVSIKCGAEDELDFQYYVLTECGFVVRKACIVYVNNRYERYGELEKEKLFVIKDCTDRACAKYGELAKSLQAFKVYASTIDEPEQEAEYTCKSCTYFRYCDKKMPKDGSATVFDIVNLKKASDLYQAGLVSFRQLYDAGLLKGNQLQQVEVELNNLPPQIKKKELKEFLKTLSYPIYFLDFESFNPVVPLYDNSKPYQQIVFQYSLHYQKRAGGKLWHKEFLAMPGADPRRQVAEQLCKDIPKDTCTTAYNMSFEKAQIRDLATLYPDLYDHLMNIHDNIRDLMIPFKKRMYYTKEMAGYYSIKIVLPALYPNDPNLDYNKLEGVHNGGEASSAFLAMQNMKGKELESKRAQLLKYCCLDTLAMVKVLEKLREAVL